MGTFEKRRLRLEMLCRATAQRKAASQMHPVIELLKETAEDLVVHCLILTVATLCLAPLCAGESWYPEDSKAPVLSPADVSCAEVRSLRYV